MKMNQQKGKTLWWVILVVAGIGLWGWINFGFNSELSAEEELRIKLAAVAAWREKRMIVDETGQMWEWQLYWNSTRLGQDGDLVPGYEWLQNQESVIYMFDSEHHAVRWQVMPGCESNLDPELGIDARLFESDGDSCQLWWTIDVILSAEDLEVVQVRVEESGVKL